MATKSVARSGRLCDLTLAASLKPRIALRVWPPMTEHQKKLEILLEDAARARRLAIVLDGDPAAIELERYAEALEAEIHRRAAEEGSGQ